MSLPNLAQYGLFWVVVTLLVKPLGGYMMRVFTGQKTFVDSLCVPVERPIYRLAGIDATQEEEKSPHCFRLSSLAVSGSQCITYTLLMSQISRAYSATVRSLENFPILATFRMAVRVHPV
jgi:K+-transporting ATPase ATPase A chain